MKFKYGNLSFEIELWNKKRSGFEALNVEGAVAIGWAIGSADAELFYTFPIIEGRISWEHPENVFIPDSVKNKAIQLHKDSLINKVLD